MKTSLLSLFACPVCGASLADSANGKSAVCTGMRPHCFDYARSGYLNLSASHGGEGDGKDAIRARRAFLEAGYYQKLSDRINALLEKLHAGTVLDAGCGEGYYTNRMAKNREVVGIDLSRDGIDAAAKKARMDATDTGFAVGSIFRLPLQDAAFDVVTNLFAPCAEAEFMRVLKPSGTLILVGAGERHLLGLKELLYNTPYLNPGRADLPVRMRQVARYRLSDVIDVEGNEQVTALFSMTPYYWRTSPGDREKLNGITHLKTEIDFDIFLYEKEPQ